MNIRAEKISIIEQLINVNDEGLLKKIKNILTQTVKPRPERMDIETFFAKIDESEKAFEQGRTISQDELRKEIKHWRKK
ncbi:MAG TPA: hypothetical protein VI757_08440 [Bacteroidia bacterium]|nr:hypothetical protein [Bacteroidia bacterium]